MVWHFLAGFVVCAIFWAVEAWFRMAWTFERISEAMDAGWEAAVDTLRPRVAPEDTEGVQAAAKPVPGPLDPEARYLAHVVDWGPEYTGQDGTLYRWRWWVTDQATGDHVMLGNCETQIEAAHEAWVWMQEQLGREAQQSLSGPGGA